MRAKAGDWILYGISTLGAVLFPAALKILLRAEISWLFVPAPVLAKMLLSAAALESRPPWPLPLRIASALYSACFAAVILAGVLITPYSAYAIWFESVADGAPRGVVSVLMVLLAALFSSTLAAAVLRGETVLPVYSQLLVAAGMLALVYQIRWIYLLLLLLLASGAVILSFRFVRPPNRLRNAAVFLMLFGVLAAASRLPLAFAAPRGSRLVDQRLHPGLRQAVVAVFPRFPLLYGIPGFGYGFENRRLGGTPVLSDAPIFEIRGRPGQRVYLRSAAFSIYDGRSWSRAEAEDGGTAAANGDGPSIVSIAARELPSPSLRITLLAEYYDLVPFTLDAISIHLPPEQMESISGSFEYGLRLTDPLRTDQSIFLGYGRSPGEERAPIRPLSPEQAAGYLQLPANIDPALRALASTLADPGKDARRTLRNIERHLARNYTYNLEVKNVPGSADFVEAFLFRGGEGYCVHFASAFIILARLNQIPCRYTTGFLAFLPYESAGPSGTTGTTRVSGYSSHAWPEVWLADRGWIPWEATTAVNPAYYEEIDDRWRYSYGWAGNRLTNRQLSAILGREPAALSPQQAPVPAPAQGMLLLLVPAAAAVFLGIRAGRRYGILLLAAARPTRGSAMRIVSGIARVWSGRDAPAPREAGWRQWAHFHSRSAPGLKRRFDRLLSIIQRLAYDERSFKRRDLRYLSGFYRKYSRRRGS